MHQRLVCWDWLLLAAVAVSFIAASTSKGHKEGITLAGWGPAFTVVEAAAMRICILLFATLGYSRLLRDEVGLKRDSLYLFKAVSSFVS